MYFPLYISASDSDQEAEAKRVLNRYFICGLPSRIDEDTVDYIKSNYWINPTPLGSWSNYIYKNPSM